MRNENCNTSNSQINVYVSTTANKHTGALKCLFFVFYFLMFLLLLHYYVARVKPPLWMNCMDLVELSIVFVC